MSARHFKPFNQLGNTKRDRADDATASDEATCGGGTARTRAIAEAKARDELAKKAARLETAGGGGGALPWTRDTETDDDASSSDGQSSFDSNIPVADDTDDDDEHREFLRGTPREKDRERKRSAFAAADTPGTPTAKQPPHKACGATPPTEAKKSRVRAKHAREASKWEKNTREKHDQSLQTLEKLYPPGKVLTVDSVNFIAKMETEQVTCEIEGEIETWDFRTLEWECSRCFVRLAHPDRSGKMHTANLSAHAKKCKEKRLPVEKERTGANVQPATPLTPRNPHDEAEVALTAFKQARVNFLAKYNLPDNFAESLEYHHFMNMAVDAVKHEANRGKIAHASARAIASEVRKGCDSAMIAKLRDMVQSSGGVLTVACDLGTPGWTPGTKRHIAAYVLCVPGKTVCVHIERIPKTITEKEEHDATGTFPSSEWSAFVQMGLNQVEGQLKEWGKEIQIPFRISCVVGDNASSVQKGLKDWAAQDGHEGVSVLRCSVHTLMLALSDLLTDDVFATVMDLFGRIKAKHEDWHGLNWTPVKWNSFLHALSYALAPSRIDRTLEVCPRGEGQLRVLGSAQEFLTLFEKCSNKLQAASGTFYETSIALLDFLEGIRGTDSNGKLFPWADKALHYVSDRFAYLASPAYVSWLSLQPLFNFASFADKGTMKSKLMDTLLAEIIRVAVTVSPHIPRETIESECTRQKVTWCSGHYGNAQARTPFRQAWAENHSWGFRLCDTAMMLDKYITSEAAAERPFADCVDIIDVHSGKTSDARLKDRLALKSAIRTHNDFSETHPSLSHDDVMTLLQLLYEHGLKNEMMNAAAKLKVGDVVSVSFNVAVGRSHQVGRKDYLAKLLAHRPNGFLNRKKQVDRVDYSLSVEEKEPHWIVQWMYITKGDMKSGAFDTWKYLEDHSWRLVAEDPEE